MSKSKKGEKSEKASMGKQKSKDISDVDGTEHVGAYGKHRVAEMNKAKEIKGSKEGELNVAYGEDHRGVPLDNVQRKMNKASCTDVAGENESKYEESESISKTKNTKDVKKRKKHKVRRKLEKIEFEEDGGIDGKAAGQHIQNSVRKRKKMEKKKSKYDSSLLQPENMTDNVDRDIGLAEHDGNDGKEFKRKDKKKDNNVSGLMHTDEVQIDVVEYSNKMKKHTQSVEFGSDGLLDNGSNDCSPNNNNKKVRSSGQNEDFPIPDYLNVKKENVGRDGLIRGIRFSPEEDETVKAAVLHYVERNDLGDEGLDMVLNSSKYPMVRGCWKEISNAIPYRPYLSVYTRAQVLFRRSESRKWTQEEYDLVRSYQKEHGNKWKAIADELGKDQRQVNHAWYWMKVNRNKGRWSQDEIQKLFNLVNLDLQAKLSEEKKSNYGMLKDNICWTAIGEVLSTRTVPKCCHKWYNHLTSRMVKEGVWADKDDYRLIDTLYGLDATCMEDVDWDVLLNNRAGDVCKKRWNQMVLHIGHHQNKSFSEQVQVLAQRYCPILLAARETWDNKPRVG